MMQTLSVGSGPGMFGQGSPLAGVGAKSDISCCSAWDCREFWHLAWVKQSRRIYTKGTISRKNDEFVNLIQHRIKTIDFFDFFQDITIQYIIKK